jgi:hypothetical protein
MSRPLRIEYEDAWYHVMNRGTDRKLIFTTDEHRIIFLETLKETIAYYQCTFPSHTDAGQIKRLVEMLLSC